MTTRCDLLHIRARNSHLMQFFFCGLKRGLYMLLKTVYYIPYARQYLLPYAFFDLIYFCVHYVHHNKYNRVSFIHRYRTIKESICSITHTHTHTQNQKFKDKREKSNLTWLCVSSDDYPFEIEWNGKRSRILLLSK